MLASGPSTPLRARPVSIRRPLYFMIWTPMYACARRWRIESSLAHRSRCATSMSSLELALEAELLGEERGAALEAERRHRDLPAVVHLAEHHRAVGARVVEEHLVELGRPGHLLDRRDRDAGLVHRDEEVGEALVRRRVGIGAADAEAPVRAVRERRPHLLAVDDPLVAVEHRAGLHVREVGARVGLRVALAPQLLDRLDLREEALLLLLGAVRDERRGEEALAEEADPRRRARLRVLLVEDHLLDDAGVAAAVLLGPGHARPSGRRRAASPTRSGAS